MKDILTALNDDFKQLGRERLLSQFNYSPNLNAFYHFFFYRITKFKQP